MVGEIFPKNSQKNNPIRPLPFAYYIVPVAFLVFSGLGASAYLAVSHYRVHVDIGYSSFCAISRSLNCDTVSQSPYSIFLGTPWPIWGLFGYAFWGALLWIGGIPDESEPRLWNILFILAAGFSILSIFLAYISTVYVHSYCVMCILTYGINLLLLFYAWLIRKRYQAPPLFSGLSSDIRYLKRNSRLCAIFIFPLMTTLVATVIFLPDYWRYIPPLQTNAVESGVTQTGEFWIGAENPVLVIEEFTDYQCFQCRKVHFFLRQLLAANPSKIRLVHRHFPMDDRVNPEVTRAFHRGAGRMALLAIAAGRLGKFWEANDLLFMLDSTQRTISVGEIAGSLNLDSDELIRAMQSTEVQQSLQEDIRYGIELGVKGTPSFFVNGELYLGHLPPELLNKYLE